MAQRLVMPYRISGEDNRISSLKTFRDWCLTSNPRFPERERELSELTDLDIDTIAEAYGSLVGRVASMRSNGVIRRFGATANGKDSLFRSSIGCLTWDEQIFWTCWDVHPSRRDRCIATSPAGSPMPRLGTSMFAGLPLSGILRRRYLAPHSGDRLLCCKVLDEYFIRRSSRMIV